MEVKIYSKKLDKYLDIKVPDRLMEPILELIRLRDKAEKSKQEVN